MRRRALRTLTAAVTAVLLAAGASACSGQADDGRPAAAVPSPAPTATATPDPFPTEPLSSGTRYVALGDSFAAGMGGGDEQGKCRTSPHSYPSVFTKEAGVDLIVNAACAGATTGDLLRRQLIAIDDRTDLITLSIGGNDLGVAAVAADCSAGKAVACRNELSSALSLLDVLPQRLSTVYSAVAQAAPNARIVVTGYVVMYDPGSTSGKDFGLRTAINAATVGLNQVIEDAVDAQRAKGVPMEFVRVDFAGHLLGDRDPWINQTGADAFHPTAEGYAQYAKTLVKELGTAE
ncbi:SGNH/GDSL hydrolase family protein [Leifsonia sp. F6_8S_P_1B]|uniref:SGNH/GDSL hydrolase family protein n=1 Tax=Leifsonia williamsii TaxID=3035919 RepID=A0ABT8KD62_9MICO|nr:SGNH/GDSL hydrolase family protein [Leifsonia williamsii]MDN4614908.1 SGNH/GDSL hydrolase family protein [Leifsonia williamsii]